MTIEPNPFHNSFRLHMDFKANPDDIKLYNKRGSKIPFKYKSIGKDFIIEPGNIPEGLYILKALDGDTLKTIKIIKTDSKIIV